MTRPVRLLAVVIVLLLVGDAVGLAVVGDDSSSAPSVPPAQAAALRRYVTEIEAFVERERGLPFKRKVNVELLDDEAFVERLRGEDDGGGDSGASRAAEDFLRALHLIDKRTQLGPAVQKLLGSAVAGFYDPRTKELVVRGGTPTPSVRATLAHELTHALQDQHFDLRRRSLDKRTDEAPQAFTGLVEGDAVRIQRRYFESLSAAEQAELQAEEDAVERPPGIPDVLVQVLLFPYLAGPSFVDAVFRAGGQARLDATFVTPPETSEHLVHPDRFLAGDKARPVTAPAADGPVFDRGVVGELGIVLILRPDLGDDAAKRAGEGWGGDRYVAWRKDGKACVRARFVMDSPQDLTELRAALVRWSRAHDDVTVDPPKNGALTLTSCA